MGGYSYFNVVGIHLGAPGSLFEESLPMEESVIESQMTVDASPPVTSTILRVL